MLDAKGHLRAVLTGKRFQWPVVCRQHLQLAIGADKNRPILLTRARRRRIQNAGCMIQKQVPARLFVSAHEKLIGERP